jgi:hypothetical protein
VASEQDLTGSRHDVAKEIDDVRVAGEEQHLMAGGRIRKRLGDSSRSLGVEVHEDVVHDERESDGPLCECLGEREAKAEV